MNKILQIVLSIFLQLGCEWILKKYLALSIFLQLGCEWILKKYQVKNEDDLEWIRKKY